MDFKSLQKNWDEFGKRDPLWAILTHNDKRNDCWDIDNFFETGKKDIKLIMDQSEHLNLPQRKNMALDFGCGVGRLTQAACGYFENAIGVDVAPSMIELAKKYNKYGNRCNYILNDSQNLKRFSDNSFDFIVTLITLQHMEPTYSSSYIKEFLRVLAPGGLLVFQIPSKLLDNSSLIDSKIKLPDNAFNAEIKVDHASLSASAGSRVAIKITIKNTSDIIWPAGSLSIGDHWYVDDKVISWDNERMSLQNELKPDEEQMLIFKTTVPKSPGFYKLELDLLQENVAWFVDKGSKAAKVSISVKSGFRGIFNSGRMVPNKEKYFTPVMECYAIPVEAVKCLIEECHGKLLMVKEDDVLESQYCSGTYFCSK